MGDAPEEHRRPIRYLAACARWVHVTGPATLTFFALEALCVRLKLGRWPVYGDTADGLLSNVFEALTSWAVIGFALGWPVLVALLVLSWKFSGPRKAGWQAGLLVACFLLLVLLMNLDPFGYFEWWLD